ncbi:AMP-binding protein [bacterium D16-51]|nr:AMP-binding protein [bacterium D16-59]RKI57705.1 AMP-binding protein [bacterium D16-51]
MDYYKLLAGQKPEKEALVVDGISYTYGSLVEMADRLSGSWDAGKRKFRQGQTVRPAVHIIKEKDIVTQLVSFLACSAIGEIPLIVPYDTRQYENGQLLEGLEVPSDACMAVSTSGTTGEPKIYFRTYESWAGYFPAQNDIFMVNGNSRLFMQGSLAFTGNLNLYMAQFYAGAAVIAENAFSPKKWVDAIGKQKADSIYLIPSKLMLFPKAVKEKMPGVRMIISGSQSFGKKEADELKKCFPNTKILLYYAASELNYVTYVTDKDMTEERSLIGRPFPQVEVFLQDGEIYVNTKYHVEGICCPYSLSDKAYQDEAGNFYFAGRKDDILFIRGRKISAVKIENILEQLPEIREAAVTKQDKEAGEPFLVAYIALQEGEKYQEQNIYRKLRQSLAHYEMPRRFCIVKNLPRNESGKVDKQRLNMIQ